MTIDTLFCNLTSKSIADFIYSANHSICFAGPGIQVEPAQAMADKLRQIRAEMLTVCIDFDEHVMRMGYGSIEAVKILLNAGIMVNNAAGLRNALIIVDGKGYSFTPTALFLEGESEDGISLNAMQLSHEQVSEALARLSPAAKAIAVAQSQTLEEKTKIDSLSVEVDSIPVDENKCRQVDAALKEAPPVQFDLARRVRVFESYFQYIELNLTGAAIQRRKLTIPSSIQKLGTDKVLARRLHTTFDLIEPDNDMSSKHLEAELREIRKNFTRSLGGKYGRVFLKSAEPNLNRAIESLKEKLKAYKEKVESGLQTHLEKSKNEIIKYYLPLIKENPPDALIGQCSNRDITDEKYRQWIDHEIDQVFPKVEDLISGMKMEKCNKDITFETLNSNDLIEKLKKEFPMVDWDKPYREYQAMGESKNAKTE